MSTNRLINLNFYANVAGNETEKILGTSENMSYSSLASCRLQQFPALEAARSLGINPEIWSLHSEFPEHLEEMQDAKLCIVGKLSAPTIKLQRSMAMANLAALTRLKNKKIPILAVYSDHHLIHRVERIRNLHLDLFKIADGVVFPTKKLAAMADNAISNDTKKYIIEDPWQVKDYLPYNFKNADDKFELLWFGQAKNLKYLFRILPGIAEKRYPGRGANLTILSNKLDEVRSELDRYLSNQKNGNLTFNLVNWRNDLQPHQFENALRQADVVLIPSDPKDPVKMGVSHNRLVDSIKSGCVPIASPMESYQELSKVCIITHDFPQAIYELMSDYKRISTKHSRHRETLLSRFSPAENLKKWRNAIQDMSSI
ncbi:hypothetical protein Q3Y53_01075 [Synechococcus sp. YX-04-1]|uniref:hypothetical protein n=1 Tax=Synechococcus sp. YX-04-1 TaxID=3062778 RepID=UPI0026E42ACA|nr:hypothetical protein [Synechococcus sp. YX-04-1]MDO6351121.1 hypothetical protein [Synechococcus sp. YX-04-1]